MELKRQIDGGAAPAKLSKDEWESIMKQSARDLDHEKKVNNLMEKYGKLGVKVKN